jgi:competence protein ComEC
MRPGVTSVGLLPALALIAGAACGSLYDVRWESAAWPLPALTILSLAAWRVEAGRAVAVLLAAGYLLAGAALASDARAQAFHTSLRALLDAEFGGFAIEEIGPGGSHDPIAMRAVLEEDAAVYDGYVSLRVDTVAIRVNRSWQPADGNVTVSVGGAAAAGRAHEWRAGRLVELPVIFRRPSRYLNDGVPDFERGLALDGTTLLASAKSGLLVHVLARGGPIREAAAHVRAHVRRAVAARIARHDRVTAAIVLAVLIGDRTGLPDDVRDRLQAAGTYHVIAISGGNIAILTALVLGLLRPLARGRRTSFVAIAVLLAYAQIATSGPSVWRATLMALLYLAARAADHRSSSWHAISVAAAAMVAARPLEVRDPGFILTFAATAALLEAARWVGSRRGSMPLAGSDGRSRRSRAGVWVVASLGASLAVEVALLPVSVSVFSRITWAGLVLNLVAVPMMAVVQVAGLATVLVPAEVVASAAGWIAHQAAAAIVESSALVEAAPWLVLHVPPAGASLVAAYYLALGVLARGGPVAGQAHPVRRGARALASVVLGGSLVCMIAGVGPRAGTGRPSAGSLRWTMFDVGQGEAMLVQFPDGPSVLIDSAGSPFGAGTIDMGARVLTPAVWARGVRTLDTVLLTHGDPDHIGGARSVLRDFAVPRLWHGVPVPTSDPMRGVLSAAARQRAVVEERRSGEAWTWRGARVRVLHPPEPEWERRRVRNDDSVVLEVVYGDVALLLTGDISGEIERTLVPRLTPAGTRILKVAHHGSRTSTSVALLEAWRPQLALISCGRGNTFGHPAPDVLQRLRSAGARVLRTDQDGEITIETDGRQVRVRTYVDGLKVQGRSQGSRQ